MEDISPNEIGTTQYCQGRHGSRRSGLPEGEAGFVPDGYNGEDPGVGRPRRALGVFDELLRVAERRKRQ